MGLINEFLLKDKIYQSDIKAVRELEKKYERLPLSVEERMVIEDYIACITTANSRKCKIVYVVASLLNDEEYL